MATTVERVPRHVASGRLVEHLLGWVVPLALAALTLALYLHTRSQVHTFDALSYIRDVDGRSGFFFHPHHLLYSPTGWLFFRVWQALGYAGNAELPLQTLNSIVGAALGAGLYRLVWELTRRWWAALLAAGALWFNYGFWYYAVEVEVYHLALLWLLGALALLIELATRPRQRTALLLGLLLGLAALYHQTNALLAPVVAVAALLSPGAWRARCSRLLVAGAIAAGVVVLGYGLVAVFVNGYRSLVQVRDWMFFFAETGWWGRPTRDRLSDLGQGLGTTITPQEALPFWIALLTPTLLGLPAALRRWPRVVVLALLWLGIYGSFFGWWEANNVEFWIATLLPLWLLLGLGAAELAAMLAGRQRARRVLAGALPLACCLLPLALARHNYPLIVRRGDAGHDLQRQIAAAVRAITTPADLIVLLGGIQELYLPYYEDRQHVVTVNSALIESGGDVPAALARLRERLETALHAGLALVIDGEALVLPPELATRYPVAQAELDRFWAPVRATLTPAVERNGTVYFWRLPSATELAQSTGWRWQQFAWGWQAANVTAQSFEAGWCFDPQVDPALVGPRLALAAERARALEITLRTRAQGQTAQFFWAGPDDRFSEARSVSWPLIGDGRAHVYRIALADVPGWQGTITRLRLDPLAVGDGTAATRTCIEALRLRP
ncbi:protein O-mannosyl-transferase family [Kallotenue papyrolyticum]|uniref:protein O-mannosyl-transferase family n=1 Tax=Kallotenue papyrolyticum TaxID=1325125 RepID=UPI000492CD4F|nr:glycosyltransferase family 39 protein [Kallotenue papyrolyticum]